MSPPAPPRLCITAGPTHEPIDEVRYLANRSSGRLGIALAEAAVNRGWPTTLLLGPTLLGSSDTRITTHRFSSTADLGALLDRFAPECDCLIMAAAVADFRPIIDPGTPPKIRRRDGKRLTLELEPTPDLLARAASNRHPGQCLVGFALEPRKTMIESAREKLRRKGVDLIVANPLETMDSQSIEAALIGNDAETAPGRLPKSEFAIWLLDRIEERLARVGSQGSRTV